MMKTRLLHWMIAGAAFGLLLTGSGGAWAAITLDFESLAHGGSINKLYGAHFEEDGFALDVSPLVAGEHSYFAVPGSGLGSDYTGSAAFTVLTYTASWTLSPNGDLVALSNLGGTPFDPVSITLAKWINWHDPYSVTFVGTTSGGAQLTETLTIPTDVFQQTFSFPGPFHDLTKLEWYGVTIPNGAEIYQFDNITLQQASPAVPEPSGLVTMLGLGACFACGSVLRRFRRRPGVE
jgi:hypothetical protein